MPNITRGGRMGGLLVYLAGEGRANEHQEPHLVAGDPAIMAWHDDAVLDRDGALAIARALDEPARAFGTQIMVPTKDADGHKTGVADGHVWHCSLSLRADEGVLSDEKWSAIAGEFVKRMGFTEADGKAACRWVAVRHGLSKAGNDHVHIAVSLVREDGTKASTWNDRPRAQRVAGELEVEHGLVVLESRTVGRGSRGAKPAEQARQVRTGAPETERVTLARRVRAIATAARDEGEFVRRSRREGLLIRPRYAAGRDDVVAGYSVALRAPAGERAVWFGGGHLGRDLTLPRLREQWPDTPQGAGDAVAEWNAARRGTRPVAPGREIDEPDPQMWEAYASEIGALREQLRAVPADDAGTWAQVARETSGVFAAWSVRSEVTPGPLAATSDALARFAQVRAHRVPVKRTPSASVKGVAMMLMAAADGGQSKTSQAVMLRQLANTMRALYEAHQAAGQVQAAAQIAATVRGQLAVVAARLPGVETPAPLGPETETQRAARIASRGRVQPAPGSPVPTRLDPHRQTTHAAANVTRPEKDVGR